MTKIFVLGENFTKEELQRLLKDKAEFVNTLNNESEIIIDTENFPKEKKIENIKFIDEHNSRPVPVFTSSLCVPVSELCASSKYPNRLIGIGLYDTFSNAKMIEIALAKITDEGILKNAESFLSEAGFKCAIVPPTVGLVFPRVLSMLINEAAQVYSEQIASKEDIDTAMKLGTNYPYGPLEWADRIGIDLIYNILAALENETGESRYGPHPSIKEMAKSKKKFY